jgi:hypothetical protein
MLKIRTSQPKKLASLLKELYMHLKVQKKKTLVIVIAGSGPTDRDGNQQNLSIIPLKFSV